MTKPNENEQVDEELSTDELKSVSGGVVSDGTAGWNWVKGNRPNKKDNNPDILHRGRGGSC